MLKVVAALTLSSILISGVGASGCHAKQNTNSRVEKPAVPAPEKETPASGQMKVLAEGFHSSITNPFIAVVRGSEIYKELRKLDENLPKLDVDFFETSVVVAAFLGERNTGGYAVEIAEEVSGQIHVAEKKPGKGAMVTEVITTPFKIVAVETSPNSTVALSFDDAWRQRAQSYQVTSGTFQYAGGFAGLGEAFQLKGRVLLMREAKLVTLVFDLFSSGVRETRSLGDSATGVVDKDNHIAIERMGVGSLIPHPHAGLQTKGIISDQEKKLLLELSSLATNIADGYSGHGSFEAEIGGAVMKP